MRWSFITLLPLLLVNEYPAKTMRHVFKRMNMMTAQGLSIKISQYSYKFACLSYHITTQSVALRIFIHSWIYLVNWHLKSKSRSTLSPRVCIHTTAFGQTLLHISHSKLLITTWTAFRSPKHFGINKYGKHRRGNAKLSASVKKNDVM